MTDEAKVDDAKVIALIDASIPIPKFKIGDTIWWGYTDRAAEKYQCPDCLGTKVWHVRSPAGYENETQCPRCNGAGMLGLESVTGYTRKLTIGSIRIDTGKIGSASTYDYPIEYMCVESGIGSCSIYRENLCFATEAEAQAKADEVAAKMRAEMDEGPRKRERAQVRYLSTYQWHDAELKAAIDKEFDSRYRLEQMIARIAELRPDAFLTSRDEFAPARDDDRMAWLSCGELKLDLKIITLLQEHLMDYDQTNIATLISAREDIEKKCKC
jgi:hypothetical protein